MKQYERGIQGEQAAEQWLCSQQGMICLDRRYRAEDGEIDLIMQQNEMLVFVEVKYRPASPRGTGLMAVTPAKQKRTVHAALAWLIAHGKMNHPVRFDVIEITRDGVYHVPNAYMAQGW